MKFLILNYKFFNIFSAILIASVAGTAATLPVDHIKTR
jgi:hypothetical protein